MKPLSLSSNKTFFVIVYSLSHTCVQMSLLPHFAIIRLNCNNLQQSYLTQKRSNSFTVSYAAELDVKLKSKHVHKLLHNNTVSTIRLPSTGVRVFSLAVSVDALTMLLFNYCSML